MAADLVELRMNVAALKRVDPYIKDILGTATQVALYTFSALKNEWEKTEVEGALFVCSRNGEPYNSILIMNRLNTNNLVEPIVKDLDWQMQAPFLLYRNPRNNIYGIWFYNRDECVKTTYLLENIMESLNNKQEKKPKRPTVGADIFSMLSKAQEDFNKTPMKTDSQPQSSTPRAPDVTSQSVMDFFAKANKTTHPTPNRIPTGENEPLQPLLHRLMSNPAHSVEHIEKAQRAVTPQEQRIKQERNSGVFSASNNQNLLENGLNFMRIDSPTSCSPRGTFYLQQPVTEETTESRTFKTTENNTYKSTETRTFTPPLTLLENHPQKPALMPPMMFATTGSAKEKPEVPLSSPEQPEPLTKKQMIQAFNYLLKNDPEFVTKLHEAYVKSFSEMVS